MIVLCRFLLGPGCSLVAAAGQQSKESILKIAHQFANEHKYREAFSVLSQGIIKHSKDVDLYYLRAKISQYSSDIDQAIKDYTETINLSPRKYPKAYQHRAECFYRLKMYIYVIYDTTKCLKLMPRYAKAYMLRGKAYAKIGKVRKAIENIQKAVRLAPGYARAANQLITKIYEGQGNF
ncbi:MAG: tetratricopeptide repeat protein [Deltaproteobacteria bacterium]|nr:tetratricopeptide repeat protein [Deltaproteobacteria bacterium]